MRKSVLTGVLACALLFVVTAQKAEAAPIELLNNQDTESYSVLIALANTETEILDEKLEGQIKEETPTSVMHVVQKGESLTDIAEQYETTWERLFDKNIDIENPDYIEVEMEIVIPTDDEKIEARVFEEPVELEETTEQSGTTAKKVNSLVKAKVAAAPRGAAAGNSYTAGQCTWHVKNLRSDLPNNLGNARTWVGRASAQGLATGSTPRVGAVAQLNGRNHVAVVQAVNSDGTIRISEMNFNGATFKVNYRTVAASRFTYIY